MRAGDRRLPVNYPAVTHTPAAGCTALRPVTLRRRGLASRCVTTDDTPPRPLPGGIGYVYLQLADDIVTRIRSGEFAPGSRLPGRPVLAAEYGVGEMTVRRALRELESRGVVVGAHTRGALVL